MGRVLMYPDQRACFALTVGITVVGIIMTGCTVGSMLPLILKRVGIDPATSSTPFIASLVDTLGVIIYVHVAKIVMASVIAARARSGRTEPAARAQAAQRTLRGRRLSAPLSGALAARAGPADDARRIARDDRVRRARRASRPRRRRPSRARPRAPARRAPQPAPSVAPCSTRVRVPVRRARERRARPAHVGEHRRGPHEDVLPELHARPHARVALDARARTDARALRDEAERADHDVAADLGPFRATTLEGYTFGAAPVLARVFTLTAEDGTGRWEDQEGI